MFKIRNLTKKKEIDTEFWLEEDNEGILIKAKRTDQEQDFVIASIYEDGMFLCEGRAEIADLGFRVTAKNSGLSRIRVEF